MKKKLFFLKLSSFLLIFLFSCKEDSSVILTPNGGEVYSFEIFELKPESSFSFQEENFNSSESSRLYLGSNNYNHNLYLYLKIKNELFVDNPICSEDNLLSIKSIDLKLPGITDFSDLNENLLDSSFINFFNNESSPEYYISAYKLNNNIDLIEGENSFIHEENIIEFNILSQNV